MLERRGSCVQQAQQQEHARGQRAQIEIWQHKHKGDEGIRRISAQTKRGLSAEKAEKGAGMVRGRRKSDVVKEQVTQGQKALCRREGGWDRRGGKSVQAE